MATNYEIDYTDERFTDVGHDRKQALTENEKTYGSMINESDKYYQAQIDASKAWADKQTQLQQEQTDFAIEKIEQQKGQAQKDYTKEQSGAYVDWQKQSNAYGANAENMASVGLAGSGYSESSQVSMYTTYQNRVMSAKESYDRAILNYNNAITEARLQNNSVLAEIAYEALQKQLELSLQGFQYKNQLVIEKANKKQEIDNIYHARYQDVLNQINQENALAEEIRQYNESLAMEQKKLQQSQAQWEKEYALQQERLAEEQRQFNETMAYQKKKDSASGGSDNITKPSSRDADNSSSSYSDSSINKPGDTSSSSSEKPSSSSSDQATMNSILALGYGPISAVKLNSLVEQGIVEEYKTSKGVTKFRKTAKTNKLEKLFV